MEKQIEDFYRSLRGRRVAFIGTGVTNQQCIELFARCGAQITLCDKKPDIDAFGPYAQALRKLDIRFSLGEHYLDGLAGQEMIMRTPGFEYYTPELVAAREAGAEVTSEMELFFRLCPCKIVAVTAPTVRPPPRRSLQKYWRRRGTPCIWAATWAARCCLWWTPSRPRM